MRSFEGNISRIPGGPKFVRASGDGDLVAGLLFRAEPN